MNKYLVKLAGKLPNEVKHWVRQRLKVDMPKIELINHNPKTSTKDIRNTKVVYRALAKVDRKTSRMAEREGDMEAANYDRGNAVIRRVLGSKLKGK